MTKSSKDLSFDQVIEQMQQVVQKLENGDLSLEDSLKIYEQGVALNKRGQELLGQIENRIEVLLQTTSGKEIFPMQTNSREDANADDKDEAEQNK